MIFKAPSGWISYSPGYTFIARQSSVLPESICAAQQEVHASGNVITILMMISLVAGYVCTLVIYTIVVREKKNLVHNGQDKLLECP